MVFSADDRHIEAHILLRLAYFHDDQALAAGDARGALDGFVGAFHGLDGHAGAVANHHRLARDRVPRSAARSGVRRRCRRTLVASGARRVSTPGRGQQRAEKFGRIDELDAFVFQDARDRANQRVGVLRRAAKKAISQAASPGRMELKILLCFTCPAITARFTPS